jgi:hypothetical protein
MRAAHYLRELRQGPAEEDSNSALSTGLLVFQPISEHPIRLATAARPTEEDLMRGTSD